MPDSLAGAARRLFVILLQFILQFVNFPRTDAERPKF
jgi:hypothetical protein